MAIDFSNLGGLAVDENIEQAFTFRNVFLTDKPVRVTSRPASVDYNAAYRNEIIRRAAERTTALKKDDPALLDIARDNDKVLMSETCVTGWSEVVDAKGKAVEFSPGAALEFFRALPPDIFDDYRAWVVNVENFRRKRVVDGTELGNAQPSD